MKGAGSRGPPPLQSLTIHASIIWFMPVYSQGKRKKSSLTTLAPVCFQKKIIRVWKKRPDKWLVSCRFLAVLFSICLHHAFRADKWPIDEIESCSHVTTHGLALILYLLSNKSHQTSNEIWSGSIA